MAELDCGAMVSQTFVMGDGPGIEENEKQFTLKLLPNKPKMKKKKRKKVL